MTVEYTPDQSKASHAENTYAQVRRHTQRPLDSMPSPAGVSGLLDWMFGNENKLAMLVL